MRKKRIVTVCLKMELQDFFVLSLLGGGGGGGMCVCASNGGMGGGGELNVQEVTRTK